MKLSNDEWRKRLDKTQYNVLREEGTERAGTSPLNNEKRAGVYACAGCDLPLFTSDMKFDSGTGWPSFFTTIPGVFETQDRLPPDLSAHRVSLRALRRAPRPHLRRRAEADRAALLQQRRRAEVHTEERQSLSTARVLQTSALGSCILRSRDEGEENVHARRRQRSAPAAARRSAAATARSGSSTEALCAPLETDDYQVQSVIDASPPKWHLAHVTWFFETFLLKPFLPGYQPLDARYEQHLQLVLQHRRAVPPARAAPHAVAADGASRSTHTARTSTGTWRS